MDYKKQVREGIWVHKSLEESPSIDVVSCDFHRKYVTLSDEKVVDMDVLLRDYMMPMFEGVDMHNLDTDNKSILGGLSKEDNKPRVSQKTDVEIVLDNATEKPNTDIIVGRQNNDSKTTIKEVEVTSEQQMLLNTINLTQGELTEIKVDGISISFDFDMNKLLAVSKMFNFETDDVVETLLKSESSEEIVKSLLKQVIKSLS